MNHVRQLKNISNKKVTVIPVEIGALGTIPKEWIKVLENLEIKEHAETITNYIIIKIGQNTE